MKVTILQTDIVWAQPAANIIRVEKMMQQAEDTDLFVLPEMWATGFCVEPEGIAEVSGQVHFALAPNPAHGSVTLTLEGMPAHGTVLTIHDGAGREVLRRVLHERVTRIETKGLATGVYTVTVSNPQGMSTHRLSVE